MARHTRFKPEIAEEIIKLHAAGMSIRQLIKSNKILPSRRTIYNWRTMYPEFAEALAIAQECCSDETAEEIIEIADTEYDAKKAKNRIDARIWLASKINRKKYGDKIEVDVNHTLDVSPVLLEAMERLKNITIDKPPLLEADVST